MIAFGVGVLAFHGLEHRQLQDGAAPALPLASGVGSSPHRLGDVDSLRAMAMTAVIAEHCGILPFGWMGVWLFFVISGFVVTRSLMAHAGRAPGAQLNAFYIRRAARILPIYVAYVGLGFGVSALLGGPIDWRPLLSLLLFYNNYQLAFGVGTFAHFPVGHLWTISVEMQFYLLFGFAFVLLPRRALVAALGFLLILCPALRFLGGDWLLGHGLSPLRAAFAIYSAAPLHFDSFAAGAMLALAPEDWRRWPRAGGLGLAGVLLLVAYAAAYVVIDHAQGARGLSALRGVISGILIGEDRQVWLYSAVAAASVGLLAATLAGASPWARITGSPVLQRVGRASYGGYVYHALVITLVGALLAEPTGQGMGARLAFGVARFALALAGAVGFSLLSYRFVETPIIAAVNRRLGALTGP